MHANVSITMPKPLSLSWQHANGSLKQHHYPFSYFKSYLSIFLIFVVKNWWPDPQMTLISGHPLPLSLFLISLSPPANATRQCMSTGQWYYRPDKNTTWTNYSSCKTTQTDAPAGNLVHRVSTHNNIDEQPLTLSYTDIQRHINVVPTNLYGKNITEINTHSSSSQNSVENLVQPVNRMINLSLLNINQY